MPVWVERSARVKEHSLHHGMVSVLGPARPEGILSPGDDLQCPTARGPSQAGSYRGAREPSYRARQTPVYTSLVALGSAMEWAFMVVRHASTGPHLVANHLVTQVRGAALQAQAGPDDLRPL